MNHWERITAAIKKQPVDRVPVSLWRHWPIEDEEPEGLADAMLRWQNKYDFDLLKFCPTGTYGIEDWGAETEFIYNNRGVRTITKLQIEKPEDWTKLENLDVTQGYLGNQNKALKITSDQLDGTVPILQTIFSPLTTAQKLAGDRIFTDLRCNPEEFKKGLEIIAETTINFGIEAINSGADGMFFATKLGNYRSLPMNEYQEFGEYYDRMVLDALRESSKIIMLHMHGDDIMFDLLRKYPVDAINWHDRTTKPNLKEAASVFPGMVVGGISEWTTMLTGTQQDIESEVQNAIEQTQGKGFLVAPGCVMSTETKPANVRIVCEAVKK